MKFKGFKDLLKYMGVYGSLTSWNGEKKENANDLTPGIHTKPGSDATIGYPEGYDTFWGLVFTVQVSGDFFQAFITYTGSTICMRGGAIRSPESVPWYELKLSELRLKPIKETE